MIKASKPFYMNSGFLRIFFSFLTSAVQSLFGVPLISTPLIDRAITYAYSQYQFIHIATATTLVALYEFLLTALVIWSILRLLGKRTKLIILVGSGIVIGVTFAELILR